MGGDVEVLHVGFEDAPKSFSLASDCPFALTKLAVEQLLRNASVGHAGNVACPAELGLFHGCDYVREFSSAQDLSVWDFVLPSDVKEGSEASKMESMHQSFMTSVQCPGLTSIE